MAKLLYSEDRGVTLLFGQ